MCNCKKRYTGGRLPKIDKSKDTSKIKEDKSKK
jgi:hypothetical protein